MTPREAELERENRELRAMLDMSLQRRLVFKRLLAGPATTEELLVYLSAGCREPSSERIVYAAIQSLRGIAARHGFRIPGPGKGNFKTPIPYRLEDLTA